MKKLTKHKPLRKNYLHFPPAGLNEFHKKGGRFDGYTVYFNQTRIANIMFARGKWYLVPCAATMFEADELRIIQAFLAKLGTFKKSSKSPSVRDMWDHSIG